MQEKHTLPADKRDISYDQLTHELGDLVGVSGEKVKQEWDEKVEINQDLISLIHTLKKSGCKIGLPSDAPQDLLRPILQEHDLEELFDAIVISSEVSITKRNKEIYALILDRLKIKASNTFFIDDNPNNIKMAEQLGMKGCLYKSEKELIQKIYN